MAPSFALDRQVRLSPKEASVYLRLGRMLRAIPGRLQEAIESYNGVLRHEPLHNSKTGGRGIHCRHQRRD